MLRACVGSGFHVFAHITQTLWFGETKFTWGHKVVASLRIALVLSLFSPYREKIMKTQFALAAALGLIATGTTQAALISDDFEVDSSGDYTVVQSTGDSTSTFAFDYVAAGIPLAPRSAPGDKGGLRMTANDTAGAPDQITAFHNTLVTPPAGKGYKLTVDVYMNVNLAASGTTEYAHVGIGGDGATFNSIFTPISGSGMFHAFTGEGGSGSDHRYYLDPTAGGPTTVPGSDPSMLAGSANGTAALYQSIFPTTAVPGSPTNIWTTLEIQALSGRLTVSYDGNMIIDAPFTGNLAGLASLGYADVFSSVANPFQSQFGVYDNLVVEVVPEPASAALLGLAGLALTRRR